MTFIERLRLYAVTGTLYCGMLLECTLYCQVCDYQARLLAPPAIAH